VRLRPSENASQVCLKHDLKISPSPQVTSDRLDYFGNHAVYFSIDESHRHLTIDSQSEVEVRPPHDRAVSRSMPWERVCQSLREAADQEALLAREFCFDSAYVACSVELASYALSSFERDRPVVEAALDLTQRIHSDFEFVPGSTAVGTPISEVLKTRRGVCQDFAHLEIGCLRSIGLAARYISGYLATTPPRGHGRLLGADVSHAWISVFSPECGWVDFDPTNGLMPTAGHIAVARARDYDDLGPIRGVLVGGRRQKLEVAVDIVPLAEEKQFG
jgi:transglutaminase-like putative cysteine protease